MQGLFNQTLNKLKLITPTESDEK